MKKLLVGLLLIAGSLGAQEIAPCLAITGADSTTADRCIPVPPPPDTTPPPVPSDSFAVAYDRWMPSRTGECTAEQHNEYSVVGPDGKLYPTWHPPVHPSGCFFGHEHGDDPSGSDLHASVGDIPFGLANEALQEAGTIIRHEDHVGHKVHLMNDMVIDGSGGSIVCDVLVKVHQGSHGADAFKNNLHEMTTHMACDDGSEVHLTTLVNVGPWGSFKEVCTSETVVTAIGDPPDGLPSGFGGTRFIPTRECVDRNIARPGTYWRWAGITENWAFDQTIHDASGKRLAFIASYSFVSLPSRYYDNDTGALRRTLDICYEDAGPTDGRRREHCKEVRDAGVTAWDDPASPFKGTSHSVRLNQPIIANSGGLRVFYTDGYGKNGQATPFPGSIRQVVSAINNGGINLTGKSMSGDYNAPGVHAPN